jgi:hypothetical protein
MYTHNRVFTKDLDGIALDWTVAQCLGLNVDSPRFMEIFQYQHSRKQGYCYSKNWALAGDIIEESRMQLEYYERESKWIAAVDEDSVQYASEPLVAAMRSYVQSQLGDQVHVNKALFETVEI